MVYVSSQIHANTGRKVHRLAKRVAWRDDAGAGASELQENPRGRRRVNTERE